MCALHSVILLILHVSAYTPSLHHHQVQELDENFLPLFFPPSVSLILPTHFILRITEHPLCGKCGS